jgi:hypothetical protein
MDTAKQVQLAVVIDPGIYTNIVFFRGVWWSPLLSTNDLVTNECEAPESNMTIAGLN